MTDSSIVADAVHRIVAESGKILGSNLAARLRKEIPDWNPADHSARNLREFIERSVERVVINGRSGMDVLYTCKEPATLDRADSNPENSIDFWRAWVSPNSPFALVYYEDRATMTLIRRELATPEGGVRIEPTTSNEHREIAREFLKNLPAEYRVDLQSAINSSNERWWIDWMTAVRNQGRLSSWNQFRKERLQDLLRHRLLVSDLAPESQRKAAQAISTSMTQAKQSQPHSPESAPLLANPSVRAVVSAVILRMDEDDLRGLKLPVGLILDVLKDLKS